MVRHVPPGRSGDYGPDTYCLFWCKKQKCACCQGGFNDWINNGGKYIDGKMDQERIIDFEEVKNGIGSDSILMIDVRNPKERINPGHIPGTKNLPRKYIEANHS